VFFVPPVAVKRAFAAVVPPRRPVQLCIASPTFGRLKAIASNMWRWARIRIFGGLGHCLRFQRATHTHTAMGNWPLPMCQSSHSLSNLHPRCQCPGKYTPATLLTGANDNTPPTSFACSRVSSAGNSLIFKHATPDVHPASFTYAHPSAIRDSLTLLAALAYRCGCRLHACELMLVSAACENHPAYLALAWHSRPVVRILMRACSIFCQAFFHSRVRTLLKTA
jgi:hypothetical protein